MLGFFIGLFSFALLLLCLFVVLMILMQKPSANAGMGAALGGGAAEQVFGGEAGNVLTKTTVYAIIAFFVISFGLYLGTISRAGLTEQEMADLETLREMRAAGAVEDEEEEEAMDPVRLDEEEVRRRLLDDFEEDQEEQEDLDADPSEEVEIDLGAALGESDGPGLEGAGN